jgi:hypothetical protein
MRADQMYQPGQGPFPVLVLVLVPVLVPGAFLVPGRRTVRRTIMVMTVGAGLRITHAAQHAWPARLQHLDNDHRQAGAKRSQRSAPQRGLPPADRRHQ